MNKKSENNNYNFKKTLLILIIVFIFVEIGIIVGVSLSNHKKNNYVDYSTKSSLNDLSDKEKEILNIEDNEEEQKKNKIKEEVYENITTDDYKKYDKLTDEEKEKIDVIPRQEEVPIEEIEDIIEEQDLEGEIPEKYDLRDYIDIKVENQNTFGLCWAFASLNTLETFIALNNNQVKDYSEIHLDYVESNLLYGNRNIHQGGSFDVFEQYFNYSGPVLEKETKYRDQTEEEYKKFLEMKPDVIVTKTVSFPAIYKSDNKIYSEGNVTSDEDTKTIRDAIKRHIMKNGGLYASIYASNSINQYTTGGTFPNHAITLIGWDDNYSKDNFRFYDGKGKIYIPKNDGAYIAVNSWGEDFGEKGFFYISYEDENVEKDVNGILSTSLEDAHKVSDIQSDLIRNYLIDNYKNNFIIYNGEEYITDLVLNKITMLDFSNQELSNDDLKELYLFSKLASLDLSNTGIDDISSLPNLNSLYVLILANNNITNFQVLSKFDKLSYLDLSNNKIDNINFVGNIANLTNLNLNDNEIEDVTGLTNLKKLSFLHLQNNKLSDVSSLSTLPLISIDLSNNKGITGYEELNFQDLSLNNCGIKELKDISKNDNITNLFLSNNPGIIIKKGFLPNKLFNIALSNNNLNDIDFLSDLDNISILTLANNQITSLDVLPGNDSFFSIDISNNPITNIDKLNNYPVVLLSYNDSPSIDLSIFDNLTTIDSLYLNNDNITDLSLLKIKSLKSLYLSNNPNITNISSLEKIEQLSILALDNCNINSLEEISKIKDLELLSLDNNSFTDVTPLNSLRKLMTLSISNNKNLTGELTLKNLFNLNISNTNIQTIDFFKQVPYISYVDMGNNNFRDFDNLYNYYKNIDDNQYISFNLSSSDSNYTVNIDDIYDIYSKPHIYLTGIDSINIYLNGQDFDKYIINKWYLRHILLQSFNRQTKIINGSINKIADDITFEDEDVPFIIIINDVYTYKIFQ